MYPWKVGNINIDNDIEKYQFIHITAQKGNIFLSKTISPRAMVATKQDDWKIAINDDITQSEDIVLTFSGKGHKKIKIEAMWFTIISMYGVRC